MEPISQQGTFIFKSSIVNANVLYWFSVLQDVIKNITRFAGRKRKWFKIDEAIRVLQCHKPVHAEYLRKITPCCGPTNGNAQEPVNTDDNAPLRQTASHDCGLPRLHRQSYHQGALMPGKLSLDWKRQFCMYNFNVYYLNLFF